MAEKKHKLLASVAVAGGLAVGGVTGLVLGLPGVSGAQTTTTVPDAPSTTGPDTGDPAPDRPAREHGDRENCPEKDGAGAEGSGTGAATNAGFRVRGGGGRV